MDAARRLLGRSRGGKRKAESHDAEAHDAFCSWEQGVIVHSFLQSSSSGLGVTDNHARPKSFEVVAEYEPRKVGAAM